MKRKQQKRLNKNKENPRMVLKHVEHSRWPHLVCMGSLSAVRHTGHLYLSSNGGSKLAS